MPLARKVPRVHRVLSACRVPMALMVPTASMVCRVLSVHKERQVAPVQQERQVRRAFKECPVLLEMMVLQVQMASTELRDHKVLWAQWVPPALMVLMERMVPMVCRERQVRKVPKVPPEQRVRRVHKDRSVLRVSTVKPVQTELMEFKVQ